MRIASAAGRVRHVFLHDMMLELQIGVYAHEQGARQRVRINVDLAVQEREAAERLEQVLDYAIVAERVRAVAGSGHFPLVEGLAEQIAQTCLRDFRVISATIRVEKLDAFADIGSVGVEIERVQAAHRPPPQESR